MQIKVWMRWHGLSHTAQYVVNVISIDGNGIHGHYKTYSTVNPQQLCSNRWGLGFFPFHEMEKMANITLTKPKSVVK